MNVALHLPLNSTSLGQVSFSILREIYSRGIEATLFPIGEIDINTQNQDEKFADFIKRSLLNAQRSHSRNNPTFKLWHLTGSLESYSREQVLLSFYELDSPTVTELNIAKNNNTLLLSSSYAVSLFNDLGCSNTKFIPLAFDSEHFRKIPRTQNRNDIHFGLCGKLEPQRKRHLKTIETWVEKFGNKSGYFLNCAIYNNFLDTNTQSQIIGQALKGQKYWNVNFLPYMGSNSSYNQFINNNDIVLAMSGGEGWGLPEFQSVALGKHCVGVNAHAYKDWMTNENSVLINPSSKIPAYDNMFFRQGTEFNQGNIFDWNTEELSAALDEVVARFKNNPENTEGLKLQEKFTYAKMVDSILDILKSI
jgi:hypothetical protein